MTSPVNLASITRPAVLQAIAEYDELGQAEFLRRRGFGESRNFRLVYGGRFYDSKAIAGVAHGYATGRFVDNSEFSGGLATVAESLNSLGYVVDHGGKHARGGLLWDLENTTVFTRGGKSAAYKFVVLRWAVDGPDPQREPVPLSKVRVELAALLSPFAVADSAPHPADPWVALRSSGWWTLELPDDVKEEGLTHQQLRRLAIKEDLAAGLNEGVREQLRDPLWRDEATAVLTRRISELAGSSSA
ncbi:hypothetical protein MPY17_01615 [Rhodococcus opacus]|uniref:hypothetical protein n=1 Tax=Rhodococcus opacus TaxID=37919 RepID=UPI001FF5D940|nr:hypothetical protein [Rhodococcus opacus]UOT04494.1 hypothetical protein MPY17_01615 [Rhodococcus opacus]